MNEIEYVKQVRKCARFFGIKWPKDVSLSSMMEVLWDRIMEWEDDNDEEFPEEYMI